MAEPDEVEHNFFYQLFVNASTQGTRCQKNIVKKYKIIINLILFTLQNVKKLFVGIDILPLYVIKR